MGHSLVTATICFVNSTMWCTRWFLPLFLLPLPTAPPYFLVLFLFSLTLHAKPCFYCIVLLTTLFISSCYWQPFPIDSPLTVPWSENITTFAEALNATLAPSYTKPLPLVMHAVDRCWCEFSAGGFFEPFNVSHWEYLSVQRMRNDLDRQKTLQDIQTDAQNSMQARRTVNDTDETDVVKSQIDMASTILSSPSIKSWFWSRVRHLAENPFSSVSRALGDNIHARTVLDRSEESGSTPTSVETEAKISATEVAPAVNTRSPRLRHEYDLQPYGLGMVIDLRWSR